ncbi:hypothetical protein EDD15DRAFT_323393 [Pisolithus albus]|nr:hypothetical protein EDD15DRAFT_323393 [Pisolithus albus]
MFRLPNDHDVLFDFPYSSTDSTEGGLMHAVARLFNGLKHGENSLPPPPLLLVRFISDHVSKPLLPTARRFPSDLCVWSSRRSSTFDYLLPHKQLHLPNDAIWFIILMAALLGLLAFACMSATNVIHIVWLLLHMGYPYFPSSRSTMISMRDLPISASS